MALFDLIRSVIAGVFNLLFRRPLWLLRSMLIVTIRSFGFLTHFLERWLTTRNYSVLLAAAPAGLAGLGVLAVISSCVYYSSLTTADILVSRGILARNQGDEPAALLYLRRAANQTADGPEENYRRAVLLAGVGRTKDAVHIMQTLAPDTTTGYLPAHEWRATRIRQQLQALTDNESSSRISSEKDDKQLQFQQQQLTSNLRQQLEVILRLNDEHVQANHWMALLEIAEGNPDAAIEHMALVVNEQQDERLFYAQLLASRQRRTEAIEEAKRARIHYSRVVSTTDFPDEDSRIEAHLKLAGAQLMLRQYRQSVATLCLNGTEPSDERLRNALTRSFVFWSDSISISDAKEAVRKFELLEQAMRLNPNDTEVLKRLAMLSGESGTAAESSRRILDTVLSAGRAPAVVHLILGTLALNDEDTDRAVVHLKLANSASPNNPLTMNNLAYALTKHAQARQEEDHRASLDWAMKLADRAIELNPNQPEFVHTRGEVRLQIADWAAAIADLEFALRSLPGREDIHMALSKAYAAVGEPNLAALHARHAQQFSGRDQEANDLD